MGVAEQVHITEVRMVADRFGNDTGILFAGDGVANPTAVEFNIYENISRPYLTGNLVIQDDNNLYNRLNIQGTEKIILSYEPVGGNGLDTAGAGRVTKTFNIVNIQRSIKTNDYTQIISFGLIEDIGFYDLVKSVSKAYTGKGEDIIVKIAEDHLQRTVDKSKAKESRNKSFRYIVPFISPLKACKAVLSKIVTENGAPYFLYSTVASDDFILKDLETIFSEDAFNAGDPFIFSQGQVNSQSSNFNELVHNIELIDNISTDDTLKLVQKNAMMVKYSYKVFSSDETSDNDVFVPSYINTMKSGFGDLTKVRHDEEFTIGPDQNERLISASPNRLYQVFSKHYPLDTTNLGFNEEQEPGDYYLRVAKDGVLQHLISNIISIQVPGFLFSTTNPNVTVGNCVEIKVYKNQVLEGNSEDPFEPRRSGKFCILSKRHLFNITNETHTVSMELGRITDLEATV